MQDPEINHPHHQKRKKLFSRRLILILVRTFEGRKGLALWGWLKPSGSASWESGLLKTRDKWATIIEASLSAHHAFGTRQLSTQTTLNLTATGQDERHYSCGSDIAGVGHMIEPRSPSWSHWGWEINHIPSVHACKAAKQSLKYL